MTTVREQLQERLRPTGPAPSNLDAVREVAASGLAVNDCHWLIGNRSGTVIEGSTGSMTGDTIVRIASASKWLYAAYAIERELVDTAEDLPFLQMTSGYTDSTPVSPARFTVGQIAAGVDHHTTDEVGRFSYGGAHMQIHAVRRADLEDMSAADLGAEISLTIGVPVNYRQASLAGGAEMTANAYAAFLQRVVTAKLQMAVYLGDNTICTLPGQCESASYSPSPEDWGYSWGHWVEPDAYSSLGALGFYPWISKDERTYGIVAPRSAAPQQAQRFGEALREAYMTGARPRRRWAGFRSD